MDVAKSCCKHHPDFFFCPRSNFAMTSACYKGPVFIFFLNDHLLNEFTCCVSTFAYFMLAGNVGLHLRSPVSNVKSCGNFSDIIC